MLRRSEMLVVRMMREAFAEEIEGWIETRGHVATDEEILRCAIDQMEGAYSEREKALDGICNYAKKLLRNDQTPPENMLDIAAQEVQYMNVLASEKDFMLDPDGLVEYIIEGIKDDYVEQDGWDLSDEQVRIISEFAVLCFKEEQGMEVLHKKN